MPLFNAHRLNAWRGMFARAFAQVLFVGDSCAPSYCVAVLATVLLGGVLVPVSSTLDADSLAFVVAKVRPRVAFVSGGGGGAGHLLTAVRACLSRLAQSADAADGSSSSCDGVGADDGARPTVVVDVAAAAAAASAAVPGQLAWLAPGPSAAERVDVEAAFASVQAARGGGDSGGDSGGGRLGAILFTSGSTGKPKGAPFSDDLLRPVGPVTTLHPFVRVDFEPFDPTLCLSLLQTVRCGGSRALSGGLAQLMEDFKEVRPTHVAATPVLWNSIFTDYTAQVCAFFVG